MNGRYVKPFLAFTLLIAAFALAACDATAPTVRSKVDERISGHHTWTVP